MIKEQEKRLFERWRTERGYPSFIADGVFDEKTWTAEPLKLTFVLKEAHWRNGNVDLCEWVLDNTPWKTWNNIARWTKGMLEGGDYPAYLSMEERNRLLSRVSFLNLKKTGGGSRTDSRELRTYAHADAPYIREQLLLLQAGCHCLLRQMERGGQLGERGSAKAGSAGPLSACAGLGGLGRRSLLLHPFSRQRAPDACDFLPSSGKALFRPCPVAGVVRANKSGP